MNYRSEGLAYVSHIRSEHRRLEQIVRAIEQELSDASTDTWDFERQERVSDYLSLLRGELARHFAQEEEGGCIEEAVARLPVLSDTARKIERQHAALLRQLDGCTRWVESAHLSALRKAFDNCQIALRKHAALEEHVVEHGFNIAINVD